jgi:toxin-antitoxin system PIN domain toxin
VSPHLLDVNVLVALFDPDHVHHEVAHDWFADHRTAGWATCPATEQGFVRVLGNPAYGTSGVRLVDIVERLRQFRASGHHQFWHDAVAFTDLEYVRASHLRGHRQVTDVALLALAVRMRGRLATFDRTIPISAVVGATRESLTVIAPVDGPA